MEEKELNLVEKLKRVPKGTKLYSMVHGNVAFLRIVNGKYPIDTSIDSFTIDGRLYCNYDNECVLFPSRTQRNWNLFHYALKGEYVTVVSLSRKGKEIKYVCQVANDGVFDVENSEVIKSNGMIGKRAIEIRESTKDEVLTLSPLFKKGDIVKLEPKDECYGDKCYMFESRDGDTAKLVTDTTCHIYYHICRLVHATEKEALAFREDLMNRYFKEINEHGEIVECFKKGDIIRASEDGDFFTCLVINTNANTIRIKLIGDCGICCTELPFDKVLRHATNPEIEAFKNELRDEYNSMLKDGDIVPWRANKGGICFRVSNFGSIFDVEDTFSKMDDVRYNLYKRGVCNYFATRELAKHSPLYHFFHQNEKDA